ncbi:MAG: SDR family NAD(P)-dependent oxidoreductase, partial [Woeseiaceae bacterium]|nr:SDR family NAD(P)-dependent oxidoreductase [Woeseiaceae bacterium]
MPIADNIKLAVVTGGGHGIGRAICRRLSRDGCDVVVAEIEEDAAVAVAGEIGGRGYGVDVGDENGFAKFILSVEEYVGQIYLFVAHAGV